LTEHDHAEPGANEEVAEEPAGPTPEERADPTPDEPASALSETPAGETPAAETPAPHRSTRQIVAAVVVAVAVVAAATVFFLTRNQSTAIALSFSPGQTTAYHFTVQEKLTLSSGGQAFPVDATVSADAQFRVLHVDSTGTATVRITYSNVTATVGGRTQSTTIPPVTARMTRDGQMTTTGGAPIAGGQLGGPFTGGSNQLSAILPSDAVRVGDTWTKKIPVTLFGSPVTLTEHGTFLRTESVGGTDAAVVRTTQTAPMNYTVKLADYAGLFGLQSSQVPPGAKMVFSGTSAGQTTTWVDTDQKKLLKTTATVTIDATIDLTGVPGGNQTIGVKGTVSVSLAPK